MLSSANSAENMFETEFFPLYSTSHHCLYRQKKKRKEYHSSSSVDISTTKKEKPFALYYALS